MQEVTSDEPRNVFCCFVSLGLCMSSTKCWGDRFSRGRGVLGGVKICLIVRWLGQHSLAENCAKCWHTLITGWICFLFFWFSHLQLKWMKAYPGWRTAFTEYLPLWYYWIWIQRYPCREILCGVPSNKWLCVSSVPSSLKSGDRLDKPLPTPHLSTKHFVILWSIYQLRSTIRCTILHPSSRN